MARRLLTKPLLSPLSLLLFTVLLSSGAFAQSTLYLIRHAEKVEDGSRDPALTSQGESRAQQIASLLGQKAIDHVFSTSYRRTTMTAEPIAKNHGLSVARYDPGDLADFAERLKGMKGNIVVLGHSNTTPTLVNLLTGATLADLDESVYDRIYVVTMGVDGEGSYQIRYTQPRTPD